MNHKYLIHLPHSGIEIPKEYRSDYYISQQELKENIFEYADLYTDELFSSLFDTFDGVKNRYSRLLFDPERFGDDNQEEMHLKFKLGWFYENAILEKKPLRTTVNKEKIRKYFDEHHRLLNEKTKQKLELFDECTIIDCHSFSNRGYWFYEDIELPDICIGFEKNHVDEELVEIIKNEFKEYNVSVNKPYAGSLVPTNYWGKDFRVKSVMIEINKKLYLESDNITKNHNFFSIKEKIDNMLKPKNN